jgi:hypothetical protein
MAMSDHVAWYHKIIKLRSHYRAVFKGGSLSSDVVLADLRRFCKAGQPPIVLGGNGQTDIYATGMAAGKQEVYWRIAHFLHLDDAKLLQLKETIENDDN